MLQSSDPSKAILPALVEAPAAYNRLQAQQQDHSKRSDGLPPAAEAAI